MNTILIGTIHLVYNKKTDYELIWGKPGTVFII